MEIKITKCSDINNNTSGNEIKNWPYIWLQIRWLTSNYDLTLKPTVLHSEPPEYECVNVRKSVENLVDKIY